MLDKRSNFSRPIAGGFGPGEQRIKTAWTVHTKPSICVLIPAEFWLLRIGELFLMDIYPSLGGVLQKGYFAEILNIQDLLGDKSPDRI